MNSTCEQYNKKGRTKGRREGEKKTHKGNRPPVRFLQPCKPENSNFCWELQSKCPV